MAGHGPRIDEHREVDPVAVELWEEILELIALAAVEIHEDGVSERHALVGRHLHVPLGEAPESFFSVIERIA